ncbi:MAG: Txe/YoeB family addiction module toxin [Sphingorhabdus sp.]
MRLGFTAQGWDEYVTLRGADAKAHKKLDALIRECLRRPFTGTGKPEPLKNNLKGWWSRRITQEHRLVYRVMGSGDEQMLEISHCQYHY